MMSHYINLYQRLVWYVNDIAPNTYLYFVGAGTDLGCGYYSTVLVESYAKSQSLHVQGYPADFILQLAPLKMTMSTATLCTLVRIEGSTRSFACWPLARAPYLAPI
jgi:hypothetical protein